jgi:hypothetical protein
VIKRQRNCSQYNLGTLLSVQYDFLVFTHEFICTFRRAEEGPEGLKVEVSSSGGETPVMDIDTEEVSNQGESIISFELGLLSFAYSTCRG